MPGSARGERRKGSSPPEGRPQVGESVPRVYPRRLPTASRRDLWRRGRRITLVVARRFAPLAVRQAREVKKGVLPAAVIARPLREMVEDLGGTFMKFGQMVASSPGLFGDEVADEFRSCLDTGPAVPFAEVRSPSRPTSGAPSRRPSPRSTPCRSAGPRSRWSIGPGSTTGARWP